MEFKKVLISELKPAAYNPRKNLSEKDPEYQRIRKSIETFGYVDPVIVNADHTVIGGHQRLKVLKDLGHAQIDVVLLDIPKTQEKALNVALNKITGEWDFQQLSIVLSELKEEDFDISITGFSDKELKEIDEELFGKQAQQLDSEPQISRAEELRKLWGTELGQMWQCGEHRVICGDCTDPAVVKRVMQGEKADMLNTDPPYGLGGYAGRSGKFDAVIGDDQDTLRLYKTLPTSIKERYIWCEWRTYPILLKALGEPKSLIVWAKNNFGMGKGYRRQHEFCAYYGNLESTTESDLWEVDKDTKYTHPTQKPVKLAVRAINNSSKSGDVVVDYFLGSGTTMIACENLGRKCRGCEIDPGYVAVILQRYKDTFPGKEIKLLKVG